MSSVSSIPPKEFERAAAVASSILRTLEVSITEAEQAPLKRYVIALSGDSTPLRTGPDGKVGLAGDEIFSTDDHARIRELVDRLNGAYQAKRLECFAQGRVAAVWRRERVQVLRNLIASLSPNLGESPRV